MDLGQVVHVEGLVSEHRGHSSGTMYEPEQVSQPSRPVVYVALMHSTVAVAVVMSSCVLLEKATLLRGVVSRQSEGVSSILGQSVNHMHLRHTIADTHLPMFSMAPARYMAPPPDTGEKLSMKLTELFRVAWPRGKPLR